SVSSARTTASRSRAHAHLLRGTAWSRAAALLRDATQGSGRTVVGRPRVVPGPQEGTRRAPRSGRRDRPETVPGLPRLPGRDASPSRGLLGTGPPPSIRPDAGAVLAGRAAAWPARRVTAHRPRRGRSCRREPRGTSPPAPS